MIEARELRIENWVGIESTALHADGCNIENTFFQIEEVNKHCAQFIGFHAGEYYQDLKPIPLTEEWLKKFGFVLEGNLWVHGSSNLEYVKYNTFEGFLYCSDLQPLRGILYVHNLQNLYYTLTGKELVRK